jgi:hypothetical protein
MRWISERLGPKPIKMIQPQSDHLALGMGTCDKLGSPIRKTVTLSKFNSLKTITVC